jgi:uncharacterized protein with NRDE domain
MCTAIILNHAHPDYPVIIAANRDEGYARPTGLPARIDDLRVSGVDQRAGGTWFGATDGGFMCGITNQRTFRPGDPALRSRGELVIGALRLGDVAKVSAWLARLDGRDYNPFNLLFGDASRLRVAYAHERAGIVVEDVPPGVHILPNDVLDSPAFPKVARARTLLGEPRRWPALEDQLRAVLADHDRPPLDVEVPPGLREIAEGAGALCVHTPGYGTRSSTLIALEAGRTAEYWFLSGTPCVQHFMPLTW